jgi:hypothetical protein
MDWKLFESMSREESIVQSFDDLPRIEELKTVKSMLKKGLAQCVMLKSIRGPGVTHYQQGIKLTSYGWDVYHGLR